MTLERVICGAKGLKNLGTSRCKIDTSIRKNENTIHGLYFVAAPFNKVK